MYTIDPKPASKDFITALDLSSCHFSCVEEVSTAVNTGTAIPCARHGHCKPPLRAEKRLDMLTVGFPCAPFSQQRPKRHNAGSWCSHKDVKVLWSTLAHIQTMRPKGGVLENVAGLAHMDASADTKSPLEVLQNELLSLGYDSTTVHIDLSTFHCVVRRRFSCMHPESGRRSFGFIAFCEY
eukprot:6468300-Amphidinium_carterae.2